MYILTPYTLNSEPDELTGFNGECQQWGVSCMCVWAIETSEAKVPLVMQILKSQLAAQSTIENGN